MKKRNVSSRVKLEIPSQFEKITAKIGSTASPSKIINMYNTYVSPTKMYIINKLYSYNKWDEMFYSGQFCIPFIGALTYIEYQLGLQD